jgi:uncharacterized membrane protein
MPGSAGAAAHAMTSLALAASFLLLSHFLIASTPLRGHLVRRLGEEHYLASYSALTLVAFVWLIVAYLRAPALVLWATPSWATALLLPFALLGSILIAAGLSTPNPVIVRQGRLFDQPGLVRGILRVSRNPFFWGAGVLSLAQVLMLGDVAALLAFGSIAFLGIIGSFALDAKKARQHREAWRAFAAATSNVPFLAMIRDRQHLSLREIGRWRIASGFGVFLITLAFDALLSRSGMFEDVRTAFRVLQ